MSLQIDGEIPVRSVSASDRKRIGIVLKALPLTITGLLGSDKAVATAGGVDLQEIIFKLWSQILCQDYMWWGMY